MKWIKGMDAAPRDKDILVWYDHNADPYLDPNNRDRLTDYAALSEAGAFLDGRGVAVARWQDRLWESTGDYGEGYWLPAGWFSRGDFGHYEVVCNPTHWALIEAPEKEK